MLDSQRVAVLRQFGLRATADLSTYGFGTAGRERALDDAIVRHRATGPHPPIASEELLARWFRRAVSNGLIDLDRARRRQRNPANNDEAAEAGDPIQWADRRGNASAADRPDPRPKDEDVLSSSALDDAQLAVVITTRFDPADLAHRLGLDPASLGDPEDLGPAADPAAVGASVLVSLGTAVLEMHGFAQLGSRAAEAHGVQLCEGKVASQRLTGVYGGDIARVACADAANGPLLHDGVSWLQLGLRGAALVRLTDGRGLLLANGGRMVAPVAASPELVKPFAPLVAPIADWVTAQTPPWLGRELSACAAAGLSALWPATAAGLVARHTPAADPSAEVARILAGIATVEPYHDWIAQLNPQACADIADLGVAAAGQLAEELADLDDDYDPRDPTWWQSLAALCWRREQLQAARAVLAWHEASAPLDAALVQVDELGGELWAGVARPVPIDDDRLRSAAVVDPDAWWVRLGTGG